jgi:hypothetical protein
MAFRFGPARSWIHELAWLLGSWAFSWALLSQLFGYQYLWLPQMEFICTTPNTLSRMVI